VVVNMRCFLSSAAGTWGPAAEWGEHEMDYILFVRADVTLQPNDEEVMVSMTTRYHCTRIIDLAACGF